MFPHDRFRTRPRVEELESRLVPANDLFAEAIMLGGAAAASSASNVGYALEAGEPDHTGFGGTANTSAWWTWTAPASGTAQVKLDGTDFGHVLNVYTGAAVDGLTRVSGVFGSVDFGDRAAALFAAEAGKTYHFAVSGFDGGTGNIALALSQPTARPANDNFAAAEVFTGTADAATGSNVGATAEAGEPGHTNDFGSTNSASVWYTWTAAQSGVVTLDPTGTTFGAVVAVYTGGSLGSLQKVLAQGTFPGGAPGQGVSRFDARAGQTYHFALDSVTGRWGDISLSLTQNTNRPPNDDFANAQAITENAVTVGSNVGATGESGEPNNAYFVNGPHLPSVWYKWTAPTSGAVTVDLGASDFGSSVGVYVGSAVDQLGRLISAQGYSTPNGPGFAGGPVGFSATAGRTYYISVDGDQAAEGTIRLALTLTAPPGNDNFANAVVMTGREWTVEGTNVGATGESGEPDHADVTDPNFPQTSRDAAGDLGSVWYKWTAPSSGRVTAQIPAAFAGGNTFGYGAALGVYSGGAVGTLTELASVGSYFGTVPPITFAATAGTTYHFAVDGFGGTMGTFTLTAGYAPANDDFAAAQVISSTTAVRTLTGSTTHATSEPGDPANPFSPISNVWYSWTAAASGTVALKDAGGAASIGFQVFTGDALGSLTSVTPFAGFYNRDLSFEAVAGTTYRIAAAGDAQPGGFKFRFVNTTAPGMFVDGGELFVFGTGGNDRVDVSAAGRAADGSTGVRVETTFGPRRLTFDGPITAASVYTGAGRDAVTLGGKLAFPVTAILGAGDDTFRGGKGAATVYGDFADGTGVGDDVISTGDGNDTVSAGGGNNTVAAGGGNNFVYTGDGNDVITGVNGFNYVVAGSGNNRVTVGDGGNTVLTGSGNDVVRTGSGSDTVADAGGNNVFDLGAGDDYLDVTGGTVEYDFFAGTATVTLGRGVNVVNAGAGNDRVSILYSAGAAVVDGGSGDDTVVVSHGTNVLSGGSGDDVLIGGAGTDVISGGAGNDFLAGGAGRDILSGGTGNDILFAGVFSVFNPFGQSGVVSAFDLGFTGRQSLDRWNQSPNDVQTRADVRTILSAPLSDPRAADGDRDTVFGEGGADWFLGIDLDDRHDRKSGEALG